jgi:hypothetical protein
MPSLQDTYNYTFLGGLGQRFVQFWGLEVDLTTIILKKIPRHGCISINRQFHSTMENNFVGKRACSLSSTGAWVR